MTGKLIVIEGGDGSGKATQTGLLVERLRKEGWHTETIDFPRYGTPPAYFVERYLRGEYGPKESIIPRTASAFFAMDRFDASSQIRVWLEGGAIVVANRYTSANMGHMGGEIRDPEARAEFIQWLEQFEYEELKIPKPDRIVYLHVPANVGQQYVDQKAERPHLHGATRDVHEADLTHLQRAEEVFLELTRSRPDWIFVECSDGEVLLPKEQIHEMIWGVVQPCLE
ncbi:MAG: thymidylate kinase [bacterium]|nr:thymidylate kinase [bacterium]